MAPNWARAALPQSMKMELQVDLSTNNCPGDKDLRRSVRKRLGYNPFGARTGALFRVKVQRGPSGYDAVIEHLTAEGISIGERRLESESEQCSDVFDAIALSLALAAGPETPRIWGPRPRPPEAPVRAARSSMWQPFFLQASDLKETPLPLESSWYVDLSATLGKSASPGVAAFVGARLQWASLSIDLDLGIEPPLFPKVGTTTLNITQVISGASMCLRGVSLGICWRTQAGISIAQGSPLDDATTAITPVLATGLSGDWRLLSLGEAYLALKFTTLFSVFQTTFNISNTELWTSPSIHGGIGLSTGANF